jgi:hypothetical protein
MADISSYAGNVYGVVQTLSFWGIIIAIIIAACIMFFFALKYFKLKYPILIITDLGNGKINIESTKGGYFRSRSFLGVDYSGAEVMKTKKGRRINSSSTEDFHDIKGKRGLICYRKSDDPAILVPLTRVDILGKNLTAQIAPADYRDAAVSIMEQTQQETMGKFEKYLPYVALSAVGVICLIIILVTTKFATGAHENAADLLRQVMQTVAAPTPSTLPSNAP